MSNLAQQRTGLVSFMVVVLAFIASTAQAVDFPTLTGRVVDNAELLSPSIEQQLTQQLKAHEDQTTNQVVVVTVNTLQGLEIADYGYQLGRHWGIGQEDANNGVLLIVAPKQRKVRIEVGYGLEATLTDALSKHIIDFEIIPRFKKNDFPGGIQAGVNAILGILGGSVDVTEYQQRRPKSSSKADLIPTAFTIVFITLVVGSILRLMLGATVSAGLVFAGSFLVGLIISGIAFAFIVAIIATLFHLFNGASGGRGGGGYYGGGYGGGYSGGGFGGGGFGGGGGSFGGGGASGGW